jgi:hypothetical protein
MRRRRPAMRLGQIRNPSIRGRSSSSPRRARGRQARIYNARGELVRDLLDADPLAAGTRPPGGRGRAEARTSGIYYYRLTPAAGHRSSDAPARQRLEMLHCAGRSRRFKAHPDRTDRKQSQPPRALATSRRCAQSVAPRRPPTGVAGLWPPAEPA